MHAQLAFLIKSRLLCVSSCTSSKQCPRLRELFFPSDTTHRHIHACAHFLRTLDLCGGSFVGEIRGFGLHRGGCKESPTGHVNMHMHRRHWYGLALDSPTSCWHRCLEAAKLLVLTLLLTVLENIILLFLCEGVGVMCHLFQTHKSWELACRYCMTPSLFKGCH